MDGDVCTEKPLLEVLISNESFQRTLKNLINHYAYTYSRNNNIDPADLQGEALLAITTAYNAYDHTRGVSFKTYTFPYIKHALQTYCNKFCHVLSISEKAARDDLQSMTDVGILRIDHQVDNEDQEFDIPVGSGYQPNIDIEDFFFAGFSNLEKSLVTDRLVNEMSIRELSQKYKISKSRIGSMIQDLTHRMQEKYERYVEND